MKISELKSLIKECLKEGTASYAAECWATERTDKEIEDEIKEVEGRWTIKHPNPHPKNAQYSYEYMETLKDILKDRKNTMGENSQHGVTDKSMGGLEVGIGEVLDDFQSGNLNRATAIKYILDIVKEFGD